MVYVPSSRFTTAPQRGLWFAFRKRELLVRTDFTLPAELWLEDLALTPVRTQYLGEWNGIACYAAQLEAEVEAPPGMTFCDLRALYFRRSLGEELLAMAGRAVQVMEWDRTHQFCGACATPTEPHASSRSRVCPRCKLEAYPRVAPAMIVCVERGEEVLLARSPHFPPGIYSTLAGFVDPGESAEECVAREVFEEASVRVKNIRYHASQPWPFPHSLMLGFFADYESGQVVPEPGEIEDAGFYHVDALPNLFPSRRSVGAHLLIDFCRRHGRPYPVPEGL
jgi:NAD+ diphosphatase